MPVEIKALHKKQHFWATENSNLLHFDIAETIMKTKAPEPNFLNVWHGHPTLGFQAILETKWPSREPSERVRRP